MHGNVTEWCYDRGGAVYTGESVTDPTGPTTNTAQYVTRGGDYSAPGSSCRSAWRTWKWGQGRRTDGFRVVLAAEGSAPLAPEIMQQPQSQTVSVGSPAAIGVGVEHDFDVPMSYQWFLNGTNLVGRTNNLIEITSVQSSEVGEYVVIISNDYGSVTSQPATLTLSNVQPAQAGE